MFLHPSEVGFLKHLSEARVPVVEFEFPARRIVNVQSQLEKLIGQNYYLNQVSISSRLGPRSDAVTDLDLPKVGQRWVPFLSSGICLPQSPLGV